MKELYEAFTERGIKHKRKKDLADLIFTMCKCTNATGCFDIEKLEALSESFLDKLQKEYEERRQMIDACEMKAYRMLKFGVCICNFCKENKNWLQEHAELVKRVESQTKYIMGMQTN